MGKKIGVVRHKCFRNAAADAINSNKFNKYSKTQQEVKLSPEEMNPTYPTYKKTEAFGRGRGGIRGRGRGRSSSVFRRPTNIDKKDQDKQHKGERSPVNPLNPNPSYQHLNANNHSYQYLKRIATPTSTLGGSEYFQSPLDDGNLSRQTPESDKMIVTEDWSANPQGNWSSPAPNDAGDNHNNVIPADANGELE